MQHIYNREGGRYDMHIHLYRYSIQQVRKQQMKFYKKQQTKFYRQQTELYKTTDKLMGKGQNKVYCHK